MSGHLCAICGHDVVLFPLLKDRPDREYGITTLLQYYVCSSATCGHIQVFPLPCESVIKSFYSDYTTHNIQIPTGIGKLLNSYSYKTAIKQLEFLNVEFNGRKNIRILDFGCGNGILLGRLRSLGYTDIIGFDFDLLAAKFVNSQGIHCYSSLDEILTDSVDVVFLNHVIEHLPVPNSTLARLSNILRSGGLFVIRTPNAQSTLANICKTYWRGWETPRHLNLFTEKSLCYLLSSLPLLKIVKSTTSNDMLLAMAIGSVPPKFNRTKLSKVFLAGMLAARGAVSSIFKAGKGEEIVVVAKKI